MKGLTEAIREREARRRRVPRRELGEDSAAELSDTIASLYVGARVIVTFYSAGHYLTVEGDVTAIDSTFRHLTLGAERLRFDDIYRISIL